jgi:signal transduction histidine kinase/CheY-like chemotaxis protein
MPQHEDHRPGSWEFLTGGGELGALIGAFDWAGTALGRPEGWPQSLKIAVRIMLTSRQPIWIGWGKDLTYLYNDAYKAIIGGKHPRALGRPTAEVWQEIWTEIEPLLATAMTGTEGTYVEEQLLIMERNGYPEETYYTFSYSPIPDDNGAAGGIICANTDDTKRVIGERQLALLRELAAGTTDARTHEEACERSAAALATNPRDLPFSLLYMAQPQSDELVLCGASGIAGSDGGAGGGMRIVEPAAWPFDAVLRDHEAKICRLDQSFGADLPKGPWGQPPAQAALLPVAPSGEAGRGGVLVVGLNPFRLYDEDYSGFLGLVARQIGAAIASAEAYQEERRRAEALAEIDRAKTAFFSNVSHEFRTPLTLMLGPLEQLLSRPPEPARAGERALIETAHHNGLRLLKLVNSLLDFSRIEAGRVQARYEPSDLAALTAELASSFRSAVDQAGLRLAIDCPTLPEPVYVDRDMWEKIVLNLVSNAFKFTFEGEIAVTIRPAADGAMAELAVADTGTGIPASELPALFERFHRIEGAKGRTFEGSGIGLALVQELVKLHDGAIRVDSAPGRGSVFTIAVPFGTAHLPRDHVFDARPTAFGNRAQAYVEEALSWLPRAADGRFEEVGLSRSPLDDFDNPVPAAAGGRVLLADDNADMRDYVRRLLSDHGYEVEAVADGEAALAAVRARLPDLVLSDVMMPGLDGYGLLRALRADPASRDLPVLLLSARAGEEARVEGIGAGADDYLTKPFGARELLARVSTNLQMARVRREALEALRARTVELETVLETVPTGVWFTYDANASRARGNRPAAELLRLPADANPSLSAPPSERPTSYRVYRGDGEATPAGLPLQRAARGEEVRNDEIEIRFADGTSTTLLAQANPLREPATGQVVGAVAAAVDITARKQAEHALRALNETLEQRVAAEIERRTQAEAELRQVQKMEAIGALTGGVAHDMNNLLLVIQSSLERIERQLAPAFDDSTARSLQAAQRGVDRAAALTGQLLAFARRQPLDPKPVEANRLVSGMSDLLRRTLGEAISIETVLAGGLWRTHADPNQIESAILNLAVNARDAMPGGGKLTIETANTYLDDAYAAAHHEVRPGQYVMIAVSDTGVGMTKDAVERAFEPFFTTKEPGRGTGLGLSQVYGFVKQSDGHVKIYSEPGGGTTVRVYLPRLADEREPRPEQAAPQTVPVASAGEAVLVVEDDDDVRANSVESLRELGYRVVEAADGAAALRLLEEHGSVRLLFTDVGLPGGMNGRQLADEARRRRPELAVLFTTGYARNAIVHHGRLDPGVELIVKPYTYAGLARKIRDMLEAATAGAGGSK